MLAKLFEDSEWKRRGLASRERTLFDQLLIMLIFRQSLQVNATQSQVKNLAHSLKASLRHIGWNPKTADRQVNFGAHNYQKYRPEEPLKPVSSSFQETLHTELHWCLVNDIVSIADLKLHCSGEIERFIAAARSSKIVSKKLPKL